MLFAPFVNCLPRWRERPARVCTKIFKYLAECELTLYKPNIKQKKATQLELLFFYMSNILLE